MVQAERETLATPPARPPVPAVAAERHRDWRIVALHTLGCVLAALACRWGGLAESLWVDELHTAWAAVGPASDLPRRAALGNQSPFYFGLQWLLVQWLGPHELALRGTSLVCGLGLVVGVHLLVYRGTRRLAWANLSGMLVAVDSHCIFYSIEARPYAAVQLVALLHFVLFVRWLGGDLSWRVRMGHVVTGWLLFWLHYTAGLTFLAEAVALLGYAAGSRAGRRRLMAGGAQLGLVALGCAPALPHLFAIAGRGSVWSAFGAAGSPWRMLDALHGGWYVLIPGLLCFLDTAFQQLILKPPDAQAELRLRPRRLYVVWWVVPVTTAWSVARGQWLPIFVGRYLASATAAPIVLAGLFGGGMKSRTLRGAAFLALVISAAYVNKVPQLVQAGLVPTPRNEDWRGVAAELNAHRTAAQANFPVFVRSGLVEADDPNWQGPERAEYLTYPLRALYPLNSPVELIPLSNSSDFELTPEQQSQVQAAGGLWLVVRGPPSRADAYAQRFQQLMTGTWQSTDFSGQGRVQLRRLQRD